MAPCFDTTVLLAFPCFDLTAESPDHKMNPRRFNAVQKCKITKETKFPVFQKGCNVFVIPVTDFLECRLHELDGFFLL